MSALGPRRRSGSRPDEGSGSVPPLASRRVGSRADEGSGSVLTLAVAAVLVVLALALGLVIQATVAHARAQAVADLSALAAARDAQRAAFGGTTPATPCGRAEQVATHNGGRVARCAEGGGGRVSVDAVVTGSVGTARASAVAGPRPP